MIPFFDAYGAIVAWVFSGETELNERTGVRVKVGRGGTAFRVSPRLCGLEWAKGALATPGGPVSVSWKREGERVDITASAPRGVMLHFRRNASLEGLEVRLNGIPQR